MTFSEKYKRKGFTLIEMLIAVAIVGILLAFVGPRVAEFLGGFKETAAGSQMKTFRTSITMYNLHTNKYPETLKELVRKPSDPKTAEKWRGPYMEDIPDDPWGNPYKYKRTPGGAHPYELYSLGPKESEESKISAWPR